jgi:hypothetical protein
MGNKNSTAPSTYLDALWVQDRDADECHHCDREFTFSRRRHHCRCCGCVACAACWGEAVALPPEYGYPDPQRVCYVCRDFYTGRLSPLRAPRCVAVTTALRSRPSGAQPPLSEANARERLFRIYDVRVANWRPFGTDTHLTFTTKRRRRGSAMATASESATSADLAPSAAFVARCSSLEEHKGSSPGRNMQRQSSATGVGAGAAPNVAWTLPIDSILRVVRDHHATGDYITLETAQEFVRIQVVENSNVSGASAFSAGPPVDSATGMSRTLSNVFLPEAESQSVLSDGTSRTGRSRSFVVDEAGTAELYDGLQEVVTMMHELGQPGDAASLFSSTRSNSRLSQAM